MHNLNKFVLGELNRLASAIVFYIEGGILLFLGFAATATAFGWGSNLISNLCAGLVTIAGSWVIHKGYQVYKREGKLTA